MAIVLAPTTRNSLSIIKREKVPSEEDLVKEL